MHVNFTYCCIIDKMWQRATHKVYCFLFPLRKMFANPTNTLFKTNNDTVCRVTYWYTSLGRWGGIYQDSGHTELRLTWCMNYLFRSHLGPCGIWYEYIMCKMHSMSATFHLWVNLQFKTHWNQHCNYKSWSNNSCIKSMSRAWTVP